MSSFVVGKKTLNIIYCGLDEYIFKNTWSSTTDELKEILKKGLVEINKIKKEVEKEFTKEDLEQFKDYLKRYRKVLKTFVEV